MTEFYYELIDDNAIIDGQRYEMFRASELVRGPWSAAMQHGAPPSALVVRALERCAQRDDTRLSRVVVDLLGPVPSDGALWVSSRVDRPGRQIELISAEMLAAGPDGTPRPVVRASGWRMQTMDTHTLAHAGAPPFLSRAFVRDDANKQWDPTKWERNYLHSLDWLWLTEPLNEGPAGSWIRSKAELVVGETMTPIERLFSVADCSNGVGSKLPMGKWTFLNTDLAVHIFRVPVGEWIGISAETSYGPDGIGAAIGTLYDDLGAVASIQQSVLVRPRPPRERG